MEPLNRDPFLWQKAKARAKFQSSLVVYAVVNSGLWVVWALTSQRYDEFVPWPLWATVFWGLGLVLQGVAAYGGFGYEQRTQREYERRLREQNGDDAQPWVAGGKADGDEHESVSIAGRRPPAGIGRPGRRGVPDLVRRLSPARG